MPDRSPKTEGAGRRLTVLGVDGARTGWVGVSWKGAGHAPRLLFDDSLAGLVAQCDEPAVVAVDMPIGLEDHDRRACDVEVRPLLGPRRSSLFPAPLRTAIDLDSYARANAWSKENSGRGLSKQAWMLAPKIREVRDLVRSGECSTPVHETFPELSFAAMAGAPLPHPKRTWNGLAARIDLLTRHGLALPTDAGGPGRVAADDLVDAAACAWSAVRIRDGAAQRRPRDHGGPAPVEAMRNLDAPAVPHDRRPTIWW